MSTTEQKPAEQAQPKLTPEQQQRKQAGAELIQRMVTDVYFSKLAEYPHVPVPKTAEEAKQLLAIGVKLSRLSEHPTIKQAEAANRAPSLLSFADNHLNQKMAELGMNSPSPETDDAAINQLCDIYTAEPAFQEAVLAVYGE